MNKIERLELELQELELQAAVSEANELNDKLKFIEVEINSLLQEKQVAKERYYRLKSPRYGVIVNLEEKIKAKIQTEEDLKLPKAVASSKVWNTDKDLRITRITAKRIFCRNPGDNCERQYSRETGKSIWGRIDVVAALASWEEYQKKGN